MRKEDSAESNLLESDGEGEFLPEGSEESVVRPKPLALGEKEEVKWVVPWEGLAMGEADSRAPDWMGGTDLLVEHPEGMARLWVSSEYPIRNQLVNLGMRSESWDPLSE